MDVGSYLRCQFLIGWMQSYDDSSSHAMWQNLGASSLIKHTRLNDNDSH